MLERLVETMQFDEVKELIDIFEKTDLNDMEVQLDNAVVRLNRGSVSPWAGNVSGAQTPQNTTSAANVTAAPKAAYQGSDTSFVSSHSLLPADADLRSAVLSCVVF